MLYLYWKPPFQTYVVIFKLQTSYPVLEFHRRRFEKPIFFIYKNASPTNIEHNRMKINKLNQKCDF
jgi:hypothetical protein